MKTSKMMYIWLDESGAVLADTPFVAGMFLTWNPNLWQDIIRDERKRRKYYNELHFHKISRSPNDRRAAVLRKVFEKLVKYTAWYGRFIHVPQEKLGRWRGLTPAQAYDQLINAFAERFLRGVPEPEAVLVVDHKDRPEWDDFIPVGLQGILELNHSMGLIGPKTTVHSAHSYTDDMLQLADAVTAAIRQLYVPSGNPNKWALSEILRPLVNTSRIQVWEWP